ncbi:short-chain dehydrogenase/reductase [Drepanopeziza brunnea f. sp. 'multigermtubi' MB_m1]|uniref:Short-chain dehydrogenase/reductase n=1 Tax=Marssonina brunnea f. sp. multigermtubi (strain MB_m1) TaxID=1072389 RepID=K1WPD7_MARBU|nr:short-chain dehydrogenase/reductase [Drepanopeziza brunnea f. sp. 'multigermtubi' MB_m1]EKD14836.1 short-chain dehydrogenase/reductase [Drepanopeziza brunnea f. sp. 'multigermtubi' MB_m1]
MVSIKDIRKSNETFKASSQASGLVAVFVAATSGNCAWILSSTKPLLAETRASSPGGTFKFIETEISLIKNVDKACDEIESKETKVDLVFVLPGYFNAESVEGIDIPHALRYDSRIRFISNLLALLKQSPLPRVMSVPAGGRESAIDTTDLEVKNDFTFVQAAETGTTQTTLAFEELARSNPTITFIHKYPGLVNSGVIGRL